MSKEYKYIKAKIVADSTNMLNGVRAVTYELEYPRFIHGEIMTHRVFSRNASSSRAVPTVANATFNQDFVRPIVWGLNKAGMSSTELLEGEALAKAQAIWDNTAKACFEASLELSKLGLHKQWANRITEPFSTIKVVLTSTEWDNFFWLRIDPESAQPEIVYLATLMKELYDTNTTDYLGAREWHLPYITQEDREKYSIDDLLMISASCCAQASYRKLDTSLEKAKDVYNRLFSSSRQHLSPTEHQLLVMDVLEEVTFGHDDHGYYVDSKKGYTHMIITDGEDTGVDAFFSGNIRGFIQYRQLLDQSEVRLEDLSNASTRA
jgi:thymidylate synthase ThyX